MNIPIFINFAGQAINVHCIQEMYSITHKTGRTLGIVMADGSKIEDKKANRGTMWLRDTIREAVAKEVLAMETFVQHERDKGKYDE